MTNFSNSYNTFVFGLEQINSAAQTPEQFVSQIENMYKRKIAETVNYIREHQYKIVMLAGPSGSGKTTTAHLLAQALEKIGEHAVIISLDNFYLERGDVPAAEDGSQDYEAVEALDVQLVKKCLADLTTTGTCEIPKFNFMTKKREPKKNLIKLEKNSVAIIEGIHALNPIFTNSLPKDAILKIYISVKQGICDYNGEIFSRSDMRLIRRIVRDFQYRNSDAQTTLAMWGSVLNGELRYIYPFKRTSDLTINSLHIYEPCALRHLGTKVLSAVPEDSPHFKSARRLLAGLERFYPIDSKIVPPDSLVREFIGPAGGTA